MPDPLISLIIAAFVTAIGLLFLWPERGLYWRWQQARQMTERVLMEDALKHIHESEMKGRCPTVEGVARALHVPEASQLLAQMENREFLKKEDGRLCLTAQGRDYALQVMRAHRLWERYLADETGYAKDEWHTHAHRQEHLLSPEDLNALASRLGNPTHDPHGDPIPTADGRIVLPDDRLLTEIAPDQLARIVHLEDEPANLYAQLVAEGLHPGMQVRVTENSPQRVRFWAGGDEHVLAPVVAANVSVVPLPGPQQVPEVPATERLAALKSGVQATVVGISPVCQGNERRRLMDLGIVPGTLIQAEMVSPSGDPTAYRVRGALVALRREQAELIRITPEKEMV